jgi:hypothetical protein
VTDVKLAPRASWLKWTGTGAATDSMSGIRVITGNTATVLTVVPAWDADNLPQSGDTYEIWVSEVTLTASDAKTVNAGIYLPELVTGSDASDTGITTTSYFLTIDPQLPDPTGVNIADVTPNNAALIGAGYNGMDVGAYAPSVTSLQNIWQRIFKSRIFK